MDFFRSLMLAIAMHIVNRIAAVIDCESTQSLRINLKLQTQIIYPSCAYGINLQYVMCITDEPRIDDHLPSSSLHPRSPLFQTRSRNSVNHLSSSTWPGVQQTSTNHLYPIFAPAGTSVRAYSSDTRLPAQTYMVERKANGQIDTARADHVRDMGMLKSVIKHGILNRPLPPSLEEVRQNYGLDGPEFNGYWHRVANSELRRRRGEDSAAATARAERTLKLQLEKAGKDLTLTHEGLMKEATRIATQAFREKQAAPFKRHQLITMTMKKVLEEATMPQEHDRVLKSLYSKIEELEHLMERIVSKGATSNYDKTDGSGTSMLDSLPSNKANQTEGQRNSVLGPLEELQKTVLEDSETKASTSAEKADPVSTKIQQIQKLLESYKQHAADVEEETRKLKDIRSRREEILERKRKLLDQMRKQEVKVKETERFASIKPVHLPPDDVDAILWDALRDSRRITQESELHLKSSGRDNIEATTQTDGDTSFTMRKTGSERISVLRPRDSDAVAAENDGEAFADSIMDKPNTSKDGMMSTGNRLRVTEPSKADREIPISGSQDMLTAIPSPIRTSSLLSQNRKPLQNPSDALHLKVPAAGFIPIDENLVVTFQGGVPQLQSQVFEMRERLKRAYPRIDTLPYEVWKSENPRTLQTWLRILIRKWQTRFDDVEKLGPLKESTRDVRIREVLDMMVRDHDLSNEAAERMAMRWFEVFDDRGDMNGDAEGKIDRDELHAGGWGFLLDDKVDPALPRQQVPSENKTVSVVSDNTKPVVNKALSEQSLQSTGTRRMYSTSSRPPLAPDSAQEPKQPNNEKTISTSIPSMPKTSLPHLTSSGSVHMVSVSGKQDTIRTAIAIGTVSFTNPTPLALIQSNSAKKGDVLGVSRIAGIMAAKKCPDLIPLCHPIALTHVGVELRPFEAVDEGHGGVHVEAKVQCVGPTGVEMEALTAVMGAALSVVDMCKAVDKFQRVSDVRVVLKEGGKSGTWREEGWRSWQV